MAPEGYRVLLARNSREVLDRVTRPGEPIDLLILDWNLPDQSPRHLLQRVMSIEPAIAVIIHSFQSDRLQINGDPTPARFVEKRGDNIEELKGAVAAMLANT